MPWVVKAEKYCATELPKCSSMEEAKDLYELHQVKFSCFCFVLQIWFLDWKKTFWGTYTNIINPFQMLQKVASEECLHRSVQEFLCKIHCNAVITRVMGAIKSNRVISDTAL